MKIRINGFENEIILKDDKVNILEMYNPKLFAHIIESINDKCNGLDNSEIFLLDDNNEVVDFSKEAYLILDVFNINANTKKITNKLYDDIVKNMEQIEDNILEEQLKKVYMMIFEKINEMPFNIVMKDNIEIEDLVKSCNIRIDVLNYDNVLERIELVIELLAYFDLAKVLIIPNLKMFLDEKELLELYKYSLYNNVRLLLIEGRDSKALKYESILVIDEEFDEIVK